MSKKMTKADKLLGNLTAGIMVYLDNLNSGKDDHSREVKRDGNFFRKSLSEAFAYLQSNFPSRKTETLQ